MRDSQAATWPWSTWSVSRQESAGGGASTRQARPPQVSVAGDPSLGSLRGSQAAHPHGRGCARGLRRQAGGSHCSQAGRGDGRHAGQDRPGRAGRHETEERQLDKQQEAERQVPGEAPGQMRPQEQSLPADSQPLTGEGERAWRLWDVLLQHTASPKPDQSLPVADPEEWARHRQETVITMSDQIPAWLKPSPGKVVTSVLRLKLAREQGKLRAAARKGSTAKAKAKARPREESQLCRETTGPGP